MNDRPWPGDWRCMVCGDMRPDARISVAHHDDEIPRTGHYPPIPVGTNVRYCNDRPACVARAPEMAEEMAARFVGAAKNTQQEDTDA